MLQYPRRVMEESSAKLWHRNKRLYTITRLTVPRCRLSTHGCRAFFYHAGPTVWNSLQDL